MADAVLEGGQATVGGVVKSPVAGVRVTASGLLIELVGQGRVAQQKQGMAGELVRGAGGEDGQVHLQFGDADTALHGGLDRGGIGRFPMPLPVGGQVVMPGNPAITLPQEADEEGRKVAAAIDFLEADLHGGAILGLLFGHPPAQVDLGEAHLPRQTGRPYLGEDLLEQVIALGVHVMKGGGQEDTNLAAGGGLGGDRGGSFGQGLILCNRSSGHKVENTPLRGGVFKSSLRPE